MKIPHFFCAIYLLTNAIRYGTIEPADNGRTSRNFAFVNPLEKFFSLYYTNTLTR